MATTPETFSDTSSLDSLNVIPGYVESTSPTKFKSYFTRNIGGPNFFGGFRQSVPSFKVSRPKARVHHDPGDKLTGHHAFRGFVGPHTLRFNLDNGAYIDGVLDKPLNKRVEVSGRGQWVWVLPADGDSIGTDV